MAKLLYIRRKQSQSGKNVRQRLVSVLDTMVSRLVIPVTSLVWLPQWASMRWVYYRFRRLALNGSCSVIVWVLGRLYRLSQQFVGVSAVSNSIVVWFPVKLVVRKLSGLR